MNRFIVFLIFLNAFFGLRANRISVENNQKNPIAALTIARPLYTSPQPIKAQISVPTKNIKCACRLTYFTQANEYDWVYIHLGLQARKNKMHLLRIKNLTRELKELTSAYQVVQKKSDETLTMLHQSNELAKKLSAHLAREQARYSIPRLFTNTMASLEWLNKYIAFLY